MKTFKEFLESWTPKGTFTYPYKTEDQGLLDRIRTKEVIDWENKEFLRNTGIPIDLAKKKKVQKIKAS